MLLLTITILFLFIIPIQTHALTQQAGATGKSSGDNCDVSLVFVLDVSYSMSNFVSNNTSLTRIEGLRQAVTTFINMIPETGTVQVRMIKFSTHVLELTPGFIRVSNYSSKQYLVNLVNSLSLGDNTNMGDALLLAKHDLESATSRFRAVILVSDGEPNVGPDPLNISEEMKMEGIKMITVFLGNDPKGMQLMSKIATSKQYFFNVKQYNFNYQAIFNQILLHLSCTALQIRGDPGTNIIIQGSKIYENLTIPQTGVLNAPVTPGIITIHYKLNTSKYNIIGDQNRLQGDIKVKAIKNTVQVIDLPTLKDLTATVHIVINDPYMASQKKIPVTITGNNDKWEFTINLDSRGSGVLNIYSLPGKYTVTSKVNVNGCGTLERALDSFTSKAGENITVKPVLPYVDRNKITARFGENYVIPIIPIYNQQNTTINVRLNAQVIDEKGKILETYSKERTLAPYHTTLQYLPPVDIKGIKHAKLYIIYNLTMNGSKIDCSTNTIFIAEIYGNQSQLYNLLITLKEIIDKTYDQYAQKAGPTIKDFIYAYLRDVYPFVKDSSNYVKIYTQANPTMPVNPDETVLSDYYMEVKSSLPISPIGFGDGILRSQSTMLAQQIVSLVISNIPDQSRITVNDISIQIKRQKDGHIQLSIQYQTSSTIKIDYISTTKTASVSLDFSNIKNSIEQAEKSDIDSTNSIVSSILSDFKNAVLGAVDSIIPSQPIEGSITVSTDSITVSTVKEINFNSSPYSISFDVRYIAKTYTDTYSIEVQGDSTSLSMQVDLYRITVSSFHGSYKGKSISGIVEVPELDLSRLKLKLGLGGFFDFKVHFLTIDLSINSGISIIGSYSPDQPVIISFNTFGGFKFSSEIGKENSNVVSSVSMYSSKVSLGCLLNTAGHIIQDPKAVNLLILYATYPVASPILSPVTSVPVVGDVASLYFDYLGNSVINYRNDCSRQFVFSKSSVMSGVGRVEMGEGVKLDIEMGGEVSTGIEWKPFYSVKSTILRYSSSIFLDVRLGLGAGGGIGTTHGKGLGVEANFIGGILFGVSYELFDITVSDPPQPVIPANYTYVDQDGDGNVDYVIAQAVFPGYDARNVYLFFNGSKSSFLAKNISKPVSSELEFVVPGPFLAELGDPGSLVNVSLLLTLVNGSIVTVDLPAIRVPQNLALDGSRFVNVSFTPVDIDGDGVTDTLAYTITSKVPYNVSVGLYSGGQLTPIFIEELPPAVSYVTNVTVIKEGHIGGDKLAVLEASNFTGILDVEVEAGDFRVPIYVKKINLPEATIVPPWYNVKLHPKIVLTDDYVVIEFMHNGRLPSLFDYKLKLEINGETEEVSLTWTRSKLYVLIPRPLLNGSVTLDSLKIYYNNRLLDAIPINIHRVFNSGFFKLIGGKVSDERLVLEFSNTSDKPVVLNKAVLILSNYGDNRTLILSTQLVDMENNGDFLAVFMVNKSISGFINQSDTYTVGIYGYDPAGNLVFHENLSGNKFKEIISYLPPPTTSYSPIRQSSLPNESTEPVETTGATTTIHGDQRVNEVELSYSKTLIISVIVAVIMVGFIFGVYMRRQPFF